MEEIRIFLGTIERVKNFVNEVSHLECDVDIVSGRYVIDAKSIMGIFSPVNPIPSGSPCSPCIFARSSLTIS